MASAKKTRGKVESRYTVGLDKKVAREVERSAERADVSISKAIAAPVKLGLENQERRQREFFGKLKENRAGNDVSQHDRLVDEFRDLILGR